MPQENFVREFAAIPASPIQNEALYNVATALAMLDGDAGLLKELAQLFLEETPARLNQLRQALTTQDSEGIHHAAHAIKGSLGAIGALRVMDSAQSLESAARVANWQSIIPLLQHFETEYHQLCVELQQTFGE